MTRLFRRVIPVIPDIASLAGLGLLSYGVSLASLAAGVCVGGVALIAVAIGLGDDE